MDDELKRVVEAILFAAARKMDIEEIARLCKHSEDDVLTVLFELKTALDASGGPTMLVNEGKAWKLTVREKYVPVIKKVVTKTELPKSILETLAVVAYKAPVLQSKVIKIRTNKAYDHLNSLEESGMITREKYSRTKMIKLTPKFFEYFDIDPSKLRDKFKDMGDVEKAIETKEKEIESLEKQQQEQTEAQLEKPQIQMPSNVEVVPMTEIVEELKPTGVEIIEEKLGELPIFDVPKESMKPEEIAEIESAEKALHPHKKKHKKKHPAHKEEKKETTEQPEPEKGAQQAEGAETAPTAEQAPSVETQPETPSPEPKKHERKERAPKKKEIEEHAAAVAEAAKKVEAELSGKKEPEKAQEPEPLTPEQKIAQETQAKTARLKERDFEKGDGIKTTPEMETEIERKVKKILGQEPEQKDETPPSM